MGLNMLPGQSTSMPWVKMCDVVKLSDPFDPDQNVARFATVHAVGWFLYEKSQHPTESNQTLLERVAYHWYHGYFDNNYPTDTTYIGQYRTYVDDIKPKVEAEDGVWNGAPHW
jgi:hypothetical protein